MDLFVLPSLFGEGLPMVVLEAMAAGVPVVATRVPGVPEAIRHGQDGVLVDPGDADDLAQAIAGVVNGLLQLGDAASQCVRATCRSNSPTAPWRPAWLPCTGKCLPRQTATSGIG